MDAVDEAATATGEVLTERQQELRRVLEGIIGIPFTEGNALRVLRNGDEIFPAMLDAIRGAQHTVDLMTYVYWKGDVAHEFAQALSERARAGARVRLLLDAIGGFQIEKGLVEAMDRAGVQVEWFRRPFVKSPFKHNHRCHRKVLVVDETVAFTGGVGIAEEWCGDARDETEWRDTHVEVRGPAVDGLAAAFAQNWGETGRPLLGAADRFPGHPPEGPSVCQVVRGSAHIGWDDMQTLFHTVLRMAESRVQLQTAYFAPSQIFIDELCDLPRRGVEVDVLLPGPHADKRVAQLASEQAYEDLTDCGVRVWNYQPTMLHTKVMTVDGALGLIGSSNFNRRSLDHDEEVALVVLDTDVVRTFEQQFREDLERSERIDPERWANRSRLQRVQEAAMAPIRRYM